LALVKAQLTNALRALAVSFGDVGYCQGEGRGVCNAVYIDGFVVVVVVVHGMGDLGCGLLSGDT